VIGVPVDEPLPEPDIQGGNIFLINFLSETYRPKLEEYDKKIDLLYLKGILSDKMLVFDDANLKIGCIRSVSTEWRQATLKLYLGNKNTSSEVNNIVFSKDI
jgi:hypothetical protein